MELGLFVLIGFIHISIGEETLQFDQISTPSKFKNETLTFFENKTSHSIKNNIKNDIQIKTGGLQRKRTKGKLLKKRLSHDKQTVWWPWKSYEEWRLNHQHNRSSLTIGTSAFVGHRKIGSEKGKHMKQRKVNQKETIKKRKLHRKGRRKNKHSTTTEANLSKNKISVFQTSTIRNLKSDEQRLSTKFYLTGKDDLESTAGVPVTHKNIENVNDFKNMFSSYKIKYTRATKTNFTTDKNECLVNNGGCEGLCINTPGSYKCHCPEGFRLDLFNKNCIDVNECIVRNGHGPCQGECYNEWGSYRCGCQSIAGTQLADDGKSCKVLDACAREDCSHLCVNTRSGAFCACPHGLVLAADWKTCVDVDECVQTDLQDTKCLGRCVNTEGSYKCL